MGAPGKNTAEARLLADKVNDLFRIKRKDDGSTYTLKDVSEACGFDLSYLSKLRRGQVGNPSLPQLRKLTDFFGVDPNYWFGARSATRLQQTPQGAILYRQLADADLTEDEIEQLNRIIADMRQVADEP